jgi:hypothetical protein
MPKDHLELLKALAMQPSRSIATNLVPILSALQLAGYVTLGPEGYGWTATAVGCALIEESRIPGTTSHAPKP